MEWRNEKRRIGDLHPWPINPRQINDSEAERLGQSFDTFGQVDTLAIGPDGEIYNGHQRVKVLSQLHGADYEVDVRVASRPLSEAERKRLTVYLHRGATGQFDFDMLAANFDMPDLLDWGFTEAELFGFDYASKEFKEYDENIADEVEYHECPECGHKFPK